MSSEGEAVEAGEVRSGLCVPAERERSGTAIREKTVTRRRGPSGQLIILLGQLSSYQSSPSGVASLNTTNWVKAD